MTLSACILFPPWFPIPPIGEQSLVVENATDEDWVLSVTSDFPTTFAIPAGETGEVELYAGAPATVELLDLECAEVADLVWEESFTGVRIGPDASLTGLEEIEEQGLTTFVEYFECAGGFGFGQAPEAVDPLPGGVGTLLLGGADGRAWSLDVATAELTQISSGEAFGDVEHSWSADGTQIAFSRLSEVGTSSIYVAAADGTDERLLVEDAASPAWSPDDARIAYRNTDPFAGASALWTIDVDTGETLELAEQATGPRWSPDGTRIAFISGDPSSFDPFDMPPAELRIVNADGTGLQTLAESAPFAPAPAWSPDGTLIAFNAPSDGDGDPFTQPLTIQIYDFARGEARTLVDVDGASATEAAWSPDGTRLAFTVSDIGMLETTGSLGMVAAGGGEIQQIGTLEDAYYLSPVWSPDEAWIAAARTVGAEMTSSLIAIRSDGGEEVVLAEGVTYAAAWRVAE
jgi:Tol biopolymer transport system component